MAQAGAGGARAGALPAAVHVILGHKHIHTMIVKYARWCDSGVGGPYVRLEVTSHAQEGVLRRPSRATSVLAQRSTQAERDYVRGFPGLSGPVSRDYVGKRADSPTIRLIELSASRRLRFPV